MIPWGTWPELTGFVRGLAIVALVVLAIVLLALVNR